MIVVIEDYRKSQGFASIMPAQLIRIGSAINSLKMNANAQRKVSEVEFAAVVLAKDIVTDESNFTASLPF